MQGAVHFVPTKICLIKVRVVKRFRTDITLNVSAARVCASDLVTPSVFETESCLGPSSAGEHDFPMGNLSRSCSRYQISSSESAFVALLLRGLSGNLVHGCPSSPCSSILSMILCSSYCIEAQLCRYHRCECWEPCP